MAKRPKIEMAEELLAKMGNTPEEVAAFLREKGIKGVPDDKTEDPVCRYLKEQLNTADVQIEHGDCYVDSNGTWEPSCPLPQAVDEFLIAFDQSRFTDLIEV